jgi:hypothetical protein
MKPYKGAITTWHQLTNYLEKKHVVGFFLEHPHIKGFGYTSEVVKIEGSELETQNSRYTLIGPDIGYEEYMRRLTEHRRRAGYP